MRNIPFRKWSEIGKFKTYSAINSFVVSTSSVLATDSVLHGFIEAPTMTETITVNYVSKDIIGQIGSLLISHRLGKSVDKFPKRHAVISTGLIQSSFVFDHLSMTFTNPIVILGLSSVLKNASFIGFGSLNTTVMKKLVKETDNIGNLYSQTASINTLFSSFGMLFGLALLNIPFHYRLMISGLFGLCNLLITIGISKVPEMSKVSKVPRVPEITDI